MVNKDRAPLSVEISVLPACTVIPDHPRTHVLVNVRSSTLPEWFRFTVQLHVDIFTPEDDLEGTDSGKKEAVGGSIDSIDQLQQAQATKAAKPAWQPPS